MGFDFEMFRKKPEPVSAERSDPTVFSPVLEGVPLVPAGITEKKSLQKWSDGPNEYVELPPSKNPERQVVISRLLKGTVNVADVMPVKIENRIMYLSKIMPHADIEEASLQKEIFADVALIGLLTGDVDRQYFPHGHERVTGTEHANVIVSDGKATYFDFQYAEMAHGRAVDLPDDMQVNTIILTKLGQLYERYQGPEGQAHFEAILASVDLPVHQLFLYSGASTPEGLHKRFLERISAVSDAIQARSTAEAA